MSIEFGQKFPSVNNQVTASESSAGEKTGKAQRSDNLSKLRHSIQTTFNNLTTVLGKATPKLQTTSQRLSGFFRKMPFPSPIRKQTTQASSDSSSASRKRSLSSTVSNNQNKRKSGSLSEGLKKLSNAPTLEKSQMKQLEQKLGQIKNVLEQCKDGKMKPQLSKDGTIRAVPTNFGLASHRGASEETADALHYILDTLHQGAQEGVSSNLIETFNAFKELPQMKARARTDENFAVNIQTTLAAIYENAANNPSVLTKDAILNKVIDGDASTASLLTLTHQNNSNTRNLFGDLAAHLDVKKDTLNGKDLAQAYHNVLDLADHYLKDGSSVPVGGPMLVDLRKQLTLIADKAINSGDPELKARGESLQAKIAALRRPAPPSKANFQTSLRDIQSNPSIENVNAGLELLRKAENAGIKNEDVEALRNQLTEIADRTLPFDLNQASAETLASSAHGLLHQSMVNIQPSEFDRLAWSKSDKGQTAPNIVHHTANFNRISTLLQNQILNSPDPLDAVNKVIDAAAVAVESHQYDTAMTLISAVSTQSIYRLNNAVWNKMDDEHKAKLNDLKALTTTDFNWKALREAIDTPGVTVQPHIGIVSTDLTKIDQGNPDSKKMETGADGVNIARNRLMGNIKENFISQQKKLSSLDVPFDPAFSAAVNLVALRSDASEDALYNLSLKLQPRANS